MSNKGKTMTEETNKQGKPWKIAHRCSSFEQANIHRNRIKLEDKTVEVKVKFLSSDNVFVVKTRSLLSAEEQKAQKKQKKEKKTSN